MPVMSMLPAADVSEPLLIHVCLVRQRHLSLTPTRIPSPRALPASVHLEVALQTFISASLHRASLLLLLFSHFGALTHKASIGPASKVQPPPQTHQQAQSRINHIKTARLTHRNAEQVALSSSIIRTPRPSLSEPSNLATILAHSPSLCLVPLSRPSASSLCAALRTPPLSALAFPTRKAQSLTIVRRPKCLAPPFQNRTLCIAGCFVYSFSLPPYTPSVHL
ncbi:uncharacterized protein UDID_18428 [Ustilago sp. UG-2017a]|nr:uncharacterized protein UDID_18428 [Ustilago sp. UG-2017a]